MRTSGISKILPEASLVLEDHKPLDDQPLDDQSLDGNTIGTGSRKYLRFGSPGSEEAADESSFVVVTLVLDKASWAS
jgi:hypothetical protein